MLSRRCTRFFILLANLLVTLSALSQQSGKIILINPLPIDRPDELIVLQRKTLELKLGKIALHKYLLFTTAGSRPLVVQFDDINSDGTWDEAAFLYSFKVNEKASIAVSVRDRPAAVNATVRAHVRLRRKDMDDSFGPSVITETMPVRNPATDFSKQPLPMYLTEGPAWENDKIAFRQYLDVRNGRDIFGKRIAGMVMDSVGEPGQPSYHDLQGWGMDILRVGKSLGAGAVALKTNINGRDTLIRLGGMDVTRTVYRQISEGPVRAIFSINYQWIINEKPVSIREQVSIWGGQYFYESKIIIRGAPANAKLVAGIANFYENQPANFLLNDRAILYSYGRQSENKDELGMAIMVSKKEFSEFGKTPHTGSDILDTYTISQTIHHAPLLYRFYAGWVKMDDRFNKPAQFEKFLKEEAEKANHPISIH